MAKLYKYCVGTFGTNCYIIANDATQNCFIVDPGEEADLIISKVDEKGLTPKGILLTHAHFDHVMALKDVRNKYSIPLYVHKDELDILLDNEHNMLDIYKPGYIINEPENILDDNDCIDLDNLEIKVMHTPGHTPGSVCYIFEDIIISGDTLFYENIGRYDFYGGDYQKLMESLNKISSIVGEYKICPGHGPTTTLSHEKQNNFYMQ